MLEHHPERFANRLVPLEPALLGRAVKLERSTQDAWDLVQDTLERALRCQEQFHSGADPEASLRQWLYRIMFNLFIDRCRRRSHETACDPIDSLELASPEADVPAEPWWMALDHGTVVAAIERLPHEFREVLSLQVEQKCSYREMGVRLGIPPATVGTRLLRARKRIKRLLTPAAETRA